MRTMYVAVVEVDLQRTLTARETEVAKCSRDQGSLKVWWDSLKRDEQDLRLPEDDPSGFRGERWVSCVVKTVEEVPEIEEEIPEIEETQGQYEAEAGRIVSTLRDYATRGGKP